MRRCLVAVLLAIPALAATEFTGEVVRIADGDTLTVLRGDQQIRIRLHGIDAPGEGPAVWHRGAPVRWRARLPPDRDRGFQGLMIATAAPWPRSSCRMAAV